MIGEPFAEVLSAAQAGGETAFAVLWRELQPGLLRYLRVVVVAAAEDVASETWLEVAKGLTRFSGDELGFRAWLFTIARHRALDWARREARRPTTPVSAEVLEGRASSDDPESEAVERLSTEAALALIARLPRDQAEVVTLRSVAGLDVAAVARIVGKRPGTVRVLAHRGLRHLAELLVSEQSVRGPVTP